MLSTLLLLESEINEEPDEEGERFEKLGRRLDDRRVPFLTSVARSKELVWERKKADTRWGILKIYFGEGPKTWRKNASFPPMTTCAFLATASTTTQ